MTITKNLCWEVVTGEFDAEMTGVLDDLEKQRTHLAPCFIMIDPFGVSGTPMSVVQRIFQNPRSEVYISFMYEWINRFKEVPEFEKHLDELFGCGDWRNGVDIADPEQRKDYLCGLYESQLRDAGARHVILFDLFEGDRLVYTIFFGTQSETGCNRMKEAIWKIDPIQGCAFRGSKSRQPLLNLGEPDFRPLQQALIEQFGGKGWVRVEEVISFVQSDRTDYYESQLRKGALRPMEAEGKIQVSASPKRRKGTFPTGTLLLFLP